MDITNLNKCDEICSDMVHHSKTYATEREESVTAQIAFDLIMVAHLPRIRQEKSNVGYDMACLMLMEDGFLPTDQHEEICRYYSDWKSKEAKYKGREKIIDAMGNKVSFFQSKMKFLKGEGL